MELLVIEREEMERMPGNHPQKAKRQAATEASELRTQALLTQELLSRFLFRVYALTLRFMYRRK